MSFVTIQSPTGGGLPAPACEPSYMTNNRAPIVADGSVDVTALHSALTAGAPGTLVDVREAIEFIGGRAPGATPLPMSELTARHEELRAMEAPIYLICQTGSRSEQCRRWLDEQGHDVVNVGGGTSAWRRAGLPIEG